MSIQVWDYRAEYESERDDILAAVDHVFRSRRLILGESVRRFEAECDLLRARAWRRRR
jgi:aminotransferase EvaB